MYYLQNTISDVLCSDCFFHFNIMIISHIFFKLKFDIDLQCNAYYLRMLSLCCKLSCVQQLTGLLSVYGATADWR